MSDPASAAAKALALAALLPITVVEPPLTESEQLTVAICCGLVGGMLQTLIPEGEVITWRGLAKRVIASGMVTPFIVFLAFKSMDIPAGILAVAGVAGVAGVVAWPVSTRLPGLAIMMIPEWIMERIKGGPK